MRMYLRTLSNKISWNVDFIKFYHFYSEMYRECIYFTSLP